MLSFLLKRSLMQVLEINKILDETNTKIDFDLRAQASVDMVKY